MSTSLENKVHWKLKSWKYVIDKSGSPFFELFNEKKCKDSADIWHRKMTLKIKIELCLTSKIRKNQRSRILLNTPNWNWSQPYSIFIPELSNSQLKKWGHANILIDNGRFLNLQDVREWCCSKKLLKINQEKQHWPAFAGLAKGKK